MNMEESKLRSIITDLELANRNIRLLSERVSVSEEDSLLIREAYDLIKRSINGLSEEEVLLEIYRFSENGEDE
ncbi:MAG: hypothetical protein ACOC2H_05535 [Spirochaetota bacterium]